jgi:hypothetical protein
MVQGLAASVVVESPSAEAYMQKRVRADRIVMENGNGNVMLEGNVRLTLPTPAYAVVNAPATTPYRVNPPKVDTPIPPPFEPPVRNQR